MGGDRSSVVACLFVLALAIVAAASGDSRGNISLVAFALAASSLLSLRLRRGPVERRKSRALLGVVVGVVAVLLAALEVRLEHSESALHLVTTIALQTLLLVMFLSLERRHWRGMDRVAALLCDQAAGYATVVDLRQAAPLMTAQFACSMRYGEPLTVVVLERDPLREGPGTKAFADALNRAGPDVIEYLSQLFARTQVCALVSESARRSDLVVTDAGSRVIVVSAATPEVGAEIFTERMLRASEAKLGIPLVAGIATCPADGVTLETLIASARRRVGSVEEIGARVEHHRVTEGVEMPRLPLTARFAGNET